MPLVPNGPADRIKYVIKTYRNTKTRFIIPDAIEAALMLLGRDQAATEFNFRYNALWNYLHGKKMFIASDMRRDGVIGSNQDPSDEEREAYVERLFDGMPDFMTRVANVQSFHELDFMVPWMAKELNRLGKAILRNQADMSDLEEASNALNQKGPAIGMWARANGVDITKVDLTEALEAIKTFEVDRKGGMPQGVVVYEFDDGWTVQELVGHPDDPESDFDTRAILQAEGEVMQHCVTAYCDEVLEGRVKIYSLRDPFGNPHATLEWRALSHTAAWLEATRDIVYAHAAWDQFMDDAMTVGDDAEYQAGSHDRAPTVDEVLMHPLLFIDSAMAKAGQFIQIKGKQNDIPEEKYRPRIQEFIREKLGADPTGLLMVALPGQVIAFAGRTVVAADFADEDVWSGVDLRQADFSGATLIDTEFGKISGIKIRGATFIRSCRFAGDVEGCDFEGSSVAETSFVGTGISGCNFKSSKLTGVSIYGEAGPWILVKDCDFSGAEVTRNSWAAVEFRGCDLSDVTFTDGEITEAKFKSCNMDGLVLRDLGNISDISLVDLDLTEVPEDTFSALMREAVVTDRLELPLYRHRRPR